MGVVLDPRRGAGDLRVAGVFDVVHRVVAELVAFGEDPPHRRFPPRHLLADLEEGAGDALFAQHVEEAGRVVAGAVVEGEGDGAALARAVGDEPGAAAGAADRAHRPQPEGEAAAGGEGLGAALADLAAPALQQAPGVALGRQPGVLRDQGDDELARARPLHRRPRPAPLDRLAGAVDRLQPDPAARLAPAEADPPLAAPARPAQRQAEVAGGGAPGVGMRLEPGQRQRRAGAQGEDQLPSRLREIRPDQALRLRPGRTAPPRRAWRASAAATSARVQRILREGGIVGRLGSLCGTPSILRPAFATGLD